MYEYNCKIVKVVDGDTVDVDIDVGFGIWIHNERVRLYGIDTPESRTRDLEEKKYGLAAKEFVLKYLPVGSHQTLVTIQDKSGKFGRLLGKFIVELGDDADPPSSPLDITYLNDLMVQTHHAVAYHGQSKDDIAEEHIKNREYVEI
tara:strand:- start:229 stop:666 length:438 start_codon:yes stop_codon:yes gene_type:complete